MLHMSRLVQNTYCHSERSEESTCGTGSFAALRMTKMLVLTILLLISGAAKADLQVNITQGSTAAIPIALPAFIATPPGMQQLANDITAVVVADLERSSLFRSVNPAAFIQRFGNPDEAPRFPDWKAINTQLLVVGGLRPAGSDGITASFRLYDVLSERQMTGLVFETKTNNWRRIAHLIADAIYKRVTGEDGYFDSRVAYVAESGARNKPTKRLAIMDQDGYNHRFLTDGRFLVLTPRFSPTAPIITYLGYYGREPQVHMLHVDTGRVEILGNFPGMTFAPRFAPNGRTLIFSLAKAGNTDIYTMDIGSRQIRRLTDHPSIDTSGSFSPDGSRIVFNSDRGGSEQLYTMSASGGGVQRISFGSGRYSTPVWSPRGDLIAFTRSFQGQFSVGVMRPDGSSERILSSSFLDEGPTWSPNGRVLMFFRETPGGYNGAGKSARLYSVDLTGYNLRQIPTPQDASDPAWSGLNPNF